MNPTDVRLSCRKLPPERGSVPALDPASGRQVPAEGRIAFEAQPSPAVWNDLGTALAQLHNPRTHQGDAEPLLAQVSRLSAPGPRGLYRYARVCSSQHPQEAELLKSSRPYLAQQILPAFLLWRAPRRFDFDTLADRS